MTTNSFGGALPRFDFPSQPQPAISRMARVNKALPVVLMAASVAGKSPYANRFEHFTNYSSLGRQDKAKLGCCPNHYINAFCAPTELGASRPDNNGQEECRCWIET